MELIVGTYGHRLVLLELGVATFDVLGTSIFDAENTSYLALSPDKRFLFAVSECGEDSGVYSFLVHPYARLQALPNGRIERISEVRPTSPDPCHLAYLPGFFNECGDPDNGALLTADYSGGTVTLFPVKSGRIEAAVQEVRFEGRGPVRDRQEAPHIHQIVPFGNLLLAVDLGADAIHVLRRVDKSVRPLCDGRLDRELRLERLFDIPAPAGCGPRHLVFDKGGSHFYVITELSNEILVYAMPDYTAVSDRPVLLQRLPVGDNAFPTQAGGDIQLSPDGRHVYASLRNGGDGLVICEVQSDGSLKRIGFQPTGDHVRDFFFLPEGLPPGEFLAVFCKNGGCIQLHRRDTVTGGLFLVREVPVVYGEPVHGAVYAR